MAKSRKPAPAGDRDGLKISSTQSDLYSPKTPKAKAPSYWLHVRFNGVEERYGREGPESLAVWVEGNTETTKTYNLKYPDGDFQRSIKPHGRGWAKGEVGEHSTSWHRKVVRR